MKSTLTLMLGVLVFIAGIFAWPTMDNEPKKSQEVFVPMSTVHSANRERISKEKNEPVMVEFGLKASFDSQPENTETNNQ